MQIVDCAAVSAVIVILGFMLALPLFNLAQLEGYRLHKSQKLTQYWLKLAILSVIALTAQAVFDWLSVRCDIAAVQYAGLAIGAVAAGGALFDKKVKCKRQPLVYTARVKRLLALFVLLSAAYCAAACAVTVRIKGTFYAFGLWTLTLPIWIWATLWIAAPLEAWNHKRLIAQCKRTLASRKNLLVVGITGSYAKTSVKNILRDILSESFTVYATPANYNTPMGMCLSVKEMPLNTRIFLAEMGARRKGDIKQLCDIVKPGIGIVTGIASQHLATFGSVQTIVETKEELPASLPKDGYCVFNAVNPYVMQMYRRCRCDKFGLGIDGGLRTENLVCDASGSHFDLVVAGQRIACTTCLLGEHNVQNIALAAAVAYHLGMSAEQIKKGIAKIKAIEHRLQVSRTSAGVTIIDDSYNSNEQGAKIALEVLSRFNGRKIVAAQGLVELGAREEAANFSLGRSIAGVADVAILIGKNSETMRMGMLAEGYCSANVYEAVDLAQGQALFARILKKGDVLLLQNDLTDNY